MDDWKRSFVEKLGEAKSQWSKKFDEVIDLYVTPVFSDYGEFLRNHDFTASRPQNDEGRRSFKFEMSENAYVLLIFRSNGIGTFELRTEWIVPGGEPNMEKTEIRVADVNEKWARKQVQSALDGFVEELSGSEPAESFEELLTV